MPCSSGTAASAPSSPPATLSQALNQKIRELLEGERWSQREFAQRLGVTQGAVSYLLAEKRRASVLDYYERLAGVFGVPLSALIRDLEQRVAVGKGVVAKGASDVASASSRRVFISSSSSTNESHHEDAAVFRAILALIGTRFDIPTLLDTRVDAAKAAITASVDLALADYERRRQEDRDRRPAPARRPRKRRRTAAKKRPDDRGADRPAVQSPPGPGDALPAGRDPSRGDLRRTG
jgi:transcriptional regulator with XRE-family HTH domain